MNQILLFLVLIGIFIYFTYNNNRENFTTMAENIETVANTASLYNTGNFTATNLNVTGTLTVNGVPVTGSNSTLNIPNINTGTIGANSASVNGAIAASGDIKGGSITTGGNVSSSGLITGAIQASGDIKGDSVTTDKIISSNTLNLTGHLVVSSDITGGGVASTTWMKAPGPFYFKRDQTSALNSKYFG